MPLNPADPHDLRFVITDVATNSPNKGEMYALDTSRAAAIPLPSFRVGAALPRAGTTQGEGFFVSTSRRGYVWDGANWQDVTPSPIKSYATDADLLAATDPVGSYATTQDTGNLYMRIAAGWKQLNTRQYATVADMVADIPPLQTLAEVATDGSLWEYRNPAGAGAQWVCTTIREFADLAGVQGWTTATINGDQAVALDTGVRYLRTAGSARTVPAKAASGHALGWAGAGAEPAMTPGQVGQWIDITADVGYTGTFPLTLGAPVNIRINMSDGTSRTFTFPAKTYPDAATTDGGNATSQNGMGWQLFYDGLPTGIDGTMLAEDGGHLYLRIDVADPAAIYPTAAPVAAGGWKPISTYENTEANIRAATWPLDGQQAQATDTGNFFIRRAGQWVEDPIQHYATDAALQAATPPDGTLAWADDTGNVYARVGTNWKSINTGFSDPIPIGTISAFPTTTIPAGWLQCDGSAVPADSKYDELRTLLGAGNNVPDLQGEFLRGINAGDTPLTHIDWSTGRPRVPFTTDAQGIHDHQAAAQQKIVGWTSGSPFHVLSNDTNDPEGSNVGVARTDRQGAHSHTINGGGDAETAPDHTLVVWCIKAHHNTIAPSAYQMDYQPDNTTLADGDVLKYDAAHNKWINQPSVGFGLQVVELTQTAYAALAPPDAHTLYLITGP